jgi:AcrR family transcriptional regulator
MVEHEESHFNMMQEKILQATIKLLIKKGYHGTSMSTIAKECGIHKSSLYHYFQSKDTLVLIIVENQLKNLEKSLTTTGYPKNKKSTNEFFDSLYCYFETHYSTHILIVLLAVEFLDSKFKKICWVIKKYFNEWIKFTRHYLLSPNENNISIVASKVLTLFTNHCFLKFIGISDSKSTIINSWKNVTNDYELQDNQSLNDLFPNCFKPESQIYSMQKIYFNNKEKHFLKVLITEASLEHIAKKTGLTKHSVKYILNNLSRKLVQTAI